MNHNLPHKADEVYTPDDLWAIIAVLMSPDGCPWDRKQTHRSLRENMIEEAYEAVDAIDKADPEAIKEELGDVLLQVYFHAAIAEKNQQFSLVDISDCLCRKLISRHTHVFGDDMVDDETQALSVWDQNKSREKGHITYAESLMDIPEKFPALLRSEKLQKRAARVGFDWPDPSGAKAKIFEELDEIDQALAHADDAEVEREVGDLLFAAVNYARLLGVDTEVALNGSNKRFIKRFKAMETMAACDGVDLNAIRLHTWEVYWQKAKEKQIDANG